MIDFPPVVEDFADTLHALREFVASLAPVLLQREKELFQNAMPLMAKYGAAALLTGDTLETSSLPDEVKSQLLEARRLISEFGTPPQSTKYPSVPDIIAKALPLKFVDGKTAVNWSRPEAAEIIPTHRAIDAVKKELRLLHESALMVLCARSEWFIAQLLHLYFMKYPSAAGMSEPFFSLDALASLQTIDDAKDMLIEHKVESMMRETLESWLKFFKDKPKLGMGYLTPETGRISEVFKRRNLVVHNGGRAGRRYFDEVEEALRKGIKLGEVVEVSTSYLNDSIDLIEHLFLLLAAELWKKMEASDERRGRFLMQGAVRSLEESRWATARGLSQFGMNDKDLPESIRLSNQINYWQSFKWSGRYEEIREEVEKTDFSAKAPLYQLAYAIIVDDFESCFRLIPGLLERDELKNVELYSWPLFQAIRKHPQFASFLPSRETEPSEGDTAN